MGFELMNMFGGLQKGLVNELEQCNSVISQYGLALTHEDALKIAEARDSALKNSGRIEFGSSVAVKIIDCFCDSPNINSADFPQTIAELVEIFFDCKNESLEQLSDDELIAKMKELFDGICQGSLSLLEDREMPRVLENIRAGRPMDFDPDVTEEEQADEY